ncbi:MAG: hypothetical protein R2710_03985 [Acidimicrobiales bacterium]
MIVRYNRARMYAGLFLLPLAAFVLWLGLNGEAGLGRNTIAQVVGAGMLFFATIVLSGLVWRRNGLIVGRRGELLVYQYVPWPRTRRLAGDLRDVELVSPPLPLPEPVPFATLLKQHFGTFAVSPPRLTWVTLVFQGSAGSIHADVALERVEPGFVENFAAWKTLQ